MSTIKRGAIYARFYTDMQRNESIDAQVEAIEKYAKDDNIKIVKVYIDRAKSATSDNRHEFQNSGKNSLAVAARPIKQNTLLLIITKSIEFLWKTNSNCFLCIST